jgi:hypothetical protein
MTLLGLVVVACAAEPDAGATSTTSRGAVSTTSGGGQTTVGGEPTTTTTAGATGATSGRPLAPDFTLELGDGGTYKLSEGAKPVYLVFWAEW